LGTNTASNNVFKKLKILIFLFIAAYSVG